jgi:hypothetical protein
MIDPPIGTKHSSRVDEFARAQPARASQFKVGRRPQLTGPDLNEATPGDPRDTTTPDAMLKTPQKIVIGPALSAASRDQITRWLIANKTGDKKLHAGLPACRLACRRQDRQRRAWQQQRYWRAVATRPRAGGGYLLPDADFGGVGG